MGDDPARPDGPPASGPPGAAPLSTLATRPVSRAARAASPVRSAAVDLPVESAPALIAVAPALAPPPTAQPPAPGVGADRVAAPRSAVRQRLLVRGLAVVLALGALSALAWLVLDPLGVDGVGPVQTFPEQGRIHIAPGQPHPPYNSMPATSGWHREEWPPARIMTTTVEDEVSVHMMEHGNVYVFYDCAAGGDCAQLRDQLTALVQAELDLRAGEGVYMAPHPLPDHHKIALAAWTHLQYLDKVKPAAIQAFFQTYLGVMNEARPVATPTP